MEWLCPRCGCENSKDTISCMVCFTEVSKLYIFMDGVRSLLEKRAVYATEYEIMPIAFKNEKQIKQISNRISFYLNILLITSFIFIFGGNIVMAFLDEGAQVNFQMNRTHIVSLAEENGSHLQLNSRAIASSVNFAIDSFTSDEILQSLNGNFAVSHQNLQRKADYARENINVEYFANESLFLQITSVQEQPVNSLYDNISTFIETGMVNFRILLNNLSNLF